MTTVTDPSVIRPCLSCGTASASPRHDINSTPIAKTIIDRDEAAYFALSDFDMRLISQADVHAISGVATLVPESVAETLAVVRENLVHHHREPAWQSPTARQVIDGYSMLADRGLLLMSVVGVPGSLFVLVAPLGHQLDLVRRAADLVNLPAA
ncbi:MAG: hypothetical protein KJZ65_06595 [Phycisphaerales bacterium]|nr:hypothetical protein [Phycisphaerales bacterium]